MGLICCLVVFTQTGFAEQGTTGDPTYIFYKGNALYEEGKYDEAIHEFEAVIEQGLESGNLYYNIGNCYFKKGELGKAILNYERARRLIPRDSDLKSNYKFALSRLQYDISEKSSWMKRVINVFHFLSLNEITILLSSAFVLLMLFFILRLFIRGLRKYTFLIAVCVILAIILLSIPLVERITLLNTEAVVIAENPEVRFEPLDSATTHFTLYEGMKITMLETKQEWARIRRADGKVGWIKNGEIEKI
jgi:tetratricopeptide (TPR) repeat protein